MSAVRIMMDNGAGPEVFCQYELSLDGMARLVTGTPIEQEEVGVADARLANVPPGTYTPLDGDFFIRALLAKYKGSRMWAVKI